MLKHLNISNYALIDTLDIDLHRGFSVITGETGAGKSIILGAIGLLLGQRADGKALRDASKKCVIEAHFDISRYELRTWFDEEELEYDDEDCIIRRELSPQGKSRGFINDTPVTLTQMRELGEKLIDVHSQHQNLLLRKENFQLNVVDIMASNEKERAEYAAAYSQLKEAEHELEELQKSIENSRTEEDYMRYQLNELQTAALREDEQEELEQEQETASHTEEIKTALYEVTTLLSGEDGAAVELIRQAEGKLGSAAAIYPKVTELSERLDSLYVELKDIATDIEAESERIEFNPERLAYVTERLNTIYSLEHKYHTDDIAGLLREQERLQTLLNGIDNSDEVLKEKRETVRQLTDIANKKADKLTATRKQAAKKIEAETKRSLEALGMPGVEFCIDIKASALSPEGQDKVAYLFSANKGMALRPVAEVASGGEIARLMLSLKAMISGAVKLPTIIFDEIDTGVSGRIAEQMGNIMHRMGEAERQVISITHLPQIAARGTYHYKVEKKNLSDSTSTMMRQLTKEERIDEIAQMLSGADITDAARRNAKTLLGN
ncbi:MAG: DNA repair protein RecN [Prevotella sp.]|nr:DNA repair protein RecN [Prevotella sp.]